MSDHQIPLAGVLGYPVAHSLSPQLHGYWLNKHGITGHYIPIALPPEDFETGFRALPVLGFRGVNVTLPHKEAVFRLCDDLTARAKRIGAVNTVVFHEDGRISGDNTDGYGFMENLHQNAPDWDPAGKPALVLGAGGASRAIICGLLDAGVSELRLLNRTRSRAENLAQDFGSAVQVLDFKEADAAMAGCATIVNTTSLGMEGQDPLTLSFDNAPQDALVTDIVYTPLITPFLAAAQAKGLHVVDGLGMLLHQGRPGFERWFGQAVTVDEGLRAIILGAGA